MLVAVTLAACGSASPEVGAPPRAPQPQVGAPPSVPQDPDPGPSPGPAAAGSDAVVVARVVDTGPIGDGTCVQRSYRIAIDRVVSGDVPTGPDPIWAHFESCADHPAPSPGPGEELGSSLDVGSTYELHLRRGASSNFGEDFMIQRARPR